MGVTDVMFVCGSGCCPGCMDCCGTGIGCHQVPCRCDLPCTCAYVAEADIHIRLGCARHDETADRRCRATVADGAWSFVTEDREVVRGHYRRPCRRLAKAGTVHYCHWHPGGSKE